MAGGLDRIKTGLAGAGRVVAEDWRAGPGKSLERAKEAVKPVVEVGGQFLGAAANKIGTFVAAEFRNRTKFKESDKGRWLAAKMTESKAGSMERKMDTLQAKIDSFGSSPDARGRKQQEQLIGQLEALGKMRQGAATALVGYYGDRLEKPRAKRESLDAELNGAKEARKTLSRALTDASAELATLKDARARAIRYRDYGALTGKMNDALNSLERQITVDSADLKHQESIIGNIEARVGAWDLKYGEKSAQLDQWKEVKEKGGRTGTTSERLVRKSASGSDSTIVALDRRRAARPTLETSESADDVSIDEVAELILDALKDLPTILRDKLRTFDKSIQVTPVPKRALIDAWNMTAKEKGKTALPEISRDIGGPKANMTLEEFGAVLSEAGLRNKIIEDGIERIAKHWQKGINERIKEAA